MRAAMNCLRLFSAGLVTLSILTPVYADVWEFDREGRVLTAPESSKRFSHNKPNHALETVCVECAVYAIPLNLVK